MPSREPTTATNRPTAATSSGAPGGAAGDDSATADDGACTISGIACPDEHTDMDVDYTHINSSNNKWVWSGTTSDGRSWYENDDVSDEVKYLYYSTRAGGWFLTATAPDLSAADPWVGGNVQVVFNGQAHGDSPDGVSHDAALYCGHDTGDPADGCSEIPRGDGQDYYWCDNDGTVTVSCGSGDEDGDGDGDEDGDEDEDDDAMAACLRCVNEECEGNEAHSEICSDCLGEDCDECRDAIGDSELAAFVSG